MKICLVGECGVGKTSLIKRFVYDEYDDRYLTTVGTKITKKKVNIENPDNNGPLDVQLLIWDIMGEKSFRNLVQKSYIFGTNGIICTCDLTRENTLPDLHEWVKMIFQVTGKIPFVIMGNKCDLDGQKFDLGDIKSFASGYENTLSYLSSAKTGINVELAFSTLCEIILKVLENRTS